MNTDRCDDKTKRAARHCALVLAVVCAALFFYWRSQVPDSDVSHTAKRCAESASMQAPAAAVEAKRSVSGLVLGHHAESAKTTVSDGPELDTLIQQARISAGPENGVQAIAKRDHHEDSRASLELQGLLDDSSILVREEAVEALGSLDGPAGVTALAYAMSDDSAFIRRMAIELLAENGSDAAIAALRLAIDDEDPRLRRLAVDELATTGSESAALVLQEFAADRDPMIRALAMEYLRQTRSR